MEAASGADEKVLRVFDAVAPFIDTLRDVVGAPVTMDERELRSDGSSAGQPRAISASMPDSRTRISLTKNSSCALPHSL